MSRHITCKRESVAYSIEKPWERLPDESPEEYSSFEDYLYQVLPRKVDRVRSAYPKTRLGLLARERFWDVRAHSYDELISRSRAISGARLARMAYEIPELKTRKLHTRLRLEVQHLENALLAAERVTTPGEMGPKDINQALAATAEKVHIIDDVSRETVTQDKDWGENLTVEELELVRKGMVRDGSETG